MNAPLPLAGCRIAVTRPAAQSHELIAQLRALGAAPLVCPAIAIAPPNDYRSLDTAIAQLPSYTWLIVTSVNGVAALFERMAALGAPLTALGGLRIGAIGPATARALEHHGIRADFMPSEYVAESILAEIGDVAGQRMLLPRADIARPALAIGLRAKGAEVDEIAVYRTIPGAGIAALAEHLRAGTVDAITFTSSSTVRYTLDGLVRSGLARPAAATLLNQAAIVCIGPITAETARTEGLHIAAEAQEFTGAGVVDALVAWFAHHK